MTINLFMEAYPRIILHATHGVYEVCGRRHQAMAGVVVTESSADIPPCSIPRLFT